MKDHIKNDSERALKIRFVTPGYTMECGSVRKHATTEEQELKLYSLYRKFTDDVFKVLFEK